MNLPVLVGLMVVKITLVLVVFLTTIAYVVLMERKVLGFIQLRYGPNRVGPWGLLQPLADLIKLSCPLRPYRLPTVSSPTA